MSETPLKYDSDRAHDFVKRTLHGKNLDPSLRLMPDGSKWELDKSEHDAYIDAIIGYYDNWSLLTHNVTNRVKATGKIDATIKWLQRASDHEIRQLMTKPETPRDFCLKIATGGAKKVLFENKERQNNCVVPGIDSDPENVKELIAKTVEIVDDKIRELAASGKIDVGEAKLLLLLLGAVEIQLTPDDRKFFMNSIRTKLRMRIAAIDQSQYTIESDSNDLEQGKAIVKDIATLNQRDNSYMSFRDIIRRDSLLDMYNNEMPTHGKAVSSFFDVLYP